MANHLTDAFLSPTLFWLTIGYFLTACVSTYFKRIDQFRMTGQLPPHTPSTPTALYLLSAVAEFSAKVALIVLNWQYGVLLYAIGFTLASLGVLEYVGRVLMYPVVRVALPDMPLHSGVGDKVLLQAIALPAKKRHFAAKLLWIVAWYAGLTILLDHIVRPMKACEPFLWGLAILQVYLYFYVFTLSYVRLRECKSRVAWLVLCLAIMGRVNGYDLILIPAVLLLALIISAIQRLPDLPGDDVEAANAVIEQS